jgi:hypothetical protein
MLQVLHQIEKSKPRFRELSSAEMNKSGMGVENLMKLMSASKQPGDKLF